MQVVRILWGVTCPFAKVVLGITKSASTLDPHPSALRAGDGQRHFARTTSVHRAAKQWYLHFIIMVLLENENRGCRQRIEALRILGGAKCLNWESLPGLSWYILLKHDRQISPDALRTK